MVHFLANGRNSTVKHSIHVSFHLSARKVDHLFTPILLFMCVSVAQRWWQVKNDGLYRELLTRIIFLGYFLRGIKFILWYVF